MVFGVFDVLHKGHLSFFKQARRLAKNPHLIVSLARDKNVRRIKGHRPRFSETQRLRVVKKSRLVDRAVLGGLGSYIPHIVRENPQIIALGYDQKNYLKDLRALLRQKNCKVKIARLKPFKPHIYKSSLVKKRII